MATSHRVLCGQACHCRNGRTRFLCLILLYFVSNSFSSHKTSHEQLQNVLLYWIGTIKSQFQVTELSCRFVWWYESIPVNETFVGGRHTASISSAVGDDHGFLGVMQYPSPLVGAINHASNCWISIPAWSRSSCSVRIQAPFRSWALMSVWGLMRGFESRDWGSGQSFGTIAMMLLSRQVVGIRYVSRNQGLRNAVGRNKPETRALHHDGDGCWV
jgi:hypothetical protein